MNPGMNHEIAGLHGRSLGIRVVGVGGAGCNAVDYMSRCGFDGVQFVAMNTDLQALSACLVEDKVQVGARTTRGMGAGGDPEVGRTAAETDSESLRSWFAGIDLVFVVAGLGGGTGTGAAPVIARIARESGALVLAIATLPFACEGARRQRQALAGMKDLKSSADGVLCLPNETMFRVMDERTPLPEAFAIVNDTLSQGVRGLWQMLTLRGLINVDFADVSSVLRGRHAENFLATAESLGDGRVRHVLDRLAASPFLEDGHALAECDALVVSVLGGPDLGMGEVNHLVDQLQRQCENAHVILGAVVDQEHEGRLSVTVLGSRRQVGAVAVLEDESAIAESGSGPEVPLEHTVDGVETGTGFFQKAESPRPASRFVPPAPELTAERREELLSRKSRQGRGRKTSKMRQGLLPLEIVSKGRFEKSEPTIHQGEDLDVPTYIRRGVALN